MDLFISWSGERSRCAGEALRTWLPKLINALKPWLSAADIDKGSRWGAEVAGRLEQAKFSIICVTPGNLHSDWILFEAGALSKTLENTYVCPLLFGLQPADLKGPLAQFQATRATKEEILRLLQTINSALGVQSLPEDHLKEAFDLWWPKLEEGFRGLPPEGEQESPTRPAEEILGEILALSRTHARILSGLAQERAVLKPEVRAVDLKLSSDDASPAKAESPESDGIPAEKSERP